tara:strand:- start:9248 stop:11179 length:1932 start_codon:yes stop_codon:yes gene_type:complete
MNGIHYRPEIDGLRTLAVLGVLIYHAEFALGDGILLQGGFLGVDVFFVISGFLITSILRREWLQTGTISIANFYKRRARRILPALLTVMLVSLPVAWFLLLPSALIDFVKSLLASLGFCSNAYWLFSLQEYGAESALLRPFLHTWSLAVEEQFYILYPLLLLFLWRTMPRVLPSVLLLLMIASLGAAVWLTKIHPSFSFYMLPSRLWELLAGGMLVFLDDRKPWLKLGWLPRGSLPLLGTVMIIGSFIGVGQNNHPGLITTVCVGGTVLLIATAGSGGLVIRLLSTKVMVFIGLISYSLYLWHYPVFAFARIHDHSLGMWEKLSLLGVSVILASVTYFTVEQFFRKPVRISLPKFATSMGMATAAIIVFSGAVLAEGGIMNRFPKLAALYNHYEFDNTLLKREKNGKAAFFCEKQPEFSTKEDTEKVLIVGDSHAIDFYVALMLNQDGFPNMEFCLYNLEIGEPDAIFQEFYQTKKFKKADHVLISSRIAAPNHKEHGGVRDIENLEHVIRSLQQRGKNVLVATNTIEFLYIENLPPFDWFVRNTPQGSYTFDDINRFLWDNRKLDEVPPINAEIRKIARKTGAVLLEKAEYMSNPERKTCLAVTPEGRKVFYDYGHYTVEGARYYGRRIHELGWLRLESNGQ